MATDNVLETGGDWATSSNWDTNAIPADGENAYIPARLNADVTMSTSQKAIDLAVWRVAKGYGYLCGTSAAPLEIGVQTLKIDGGLGFSLALHDDGVSVALVERAWINVPGNTPVLLNKHASAMASTDYKLIRLLSGPRTMGALVTWDSGAEIQVSGGTCVLTENGETLPKMTTTGGTVNSDVGITNLVVASGTVVQDKVAIGSAHVMPGGVLDLRFGGTVISTILHVERGGTVLFDNTEDRKTVVEIHAAKGANLVYDPDITDFTADYIQ